MGKGAGSALLIIAAVIYFTLMSQLALALGYEPTSVADFTNRLGSINVGILSFLFDLVAWVISSVATYFSMIGFTVTGDIPIWLGAFFFVPVGLGVAWLVIDLMRG
jgi:hypothetical protein